MKKEKKEVTTADGRVVRITPKPEKLFTWNEKLRRTRSVG